MNENYRFGRFELDAGRLVLRRNGEPLTVEHKPLEVLAELLRSAGDLVSKNELMESVWAGRVVTESVITSCVKKLRAALGDDSQTLILTVHGYGYRFTGTVERPLPDDTAAAPLAPSEAPRLAGGLRAEDCPPLRPHWRLRHALDERGGIWLAEHDKTLERRVFKFAQDAAGVAALKRELTIHRLLQRSLGERGDLARLLDYNLEAQPYFLELEYCSHGSLVDWLAAVGGPASLSLATRLELMAQAAEAIAAAHAVGVLHLDIKPSNLLIWMTQDGHPQIRWTDFGNSRLIDPARLAELNITRLGATRPLSAAEASTLLYCPPEVLGGQPPTALSDIYALGVMLYQMVVGDLRKPVAPGWEQEVEDELLRSDIAAAAAGNPASRLASAAELAQRLRSLEPRRAALAREQTRALEAEQLQRRLEQVRMRRPWLIAVVLALSAGLGASLWSYRTALRARDSARQEAAIAVGVSRFFSEAMLGSASRFNPSVRRDLTVHESMDRTTTELDHGNTPPLVEAEVRAALAYAYAQMADYGAALTQEHRAGELFGAQLGPYDSRTLHARYFEAEMLMFQSRFADAEALLQGLDAELAGRSGLDPDVRLASLALRGSTYYRWEQYTKALPYYQQALEWDLRIHPDEAAALAARRALLALTYAHLGRFDEAGGEMQRALGDADQDRGPAHATTVALTQAAAGTVQYLQGRYAESETLLRQAGQVLDSKLGADEEDSAQASDCLGMVYLKTGHAAQAEQSLRAAYDNFRSRFGPGSASTLVAQAHLGTAEQADGKEAAGAAELEKAYTGLVQVLGPEAPDTEFAAFELAQARGSPHAADARNLLQRLDPKVLAMAAPQDAWPQVIDAARKGLGMSGSLNVPPQDASARR